MMKLIDSLGDLGTDSIGRRRVASLAPELAAEAGDAERWTREAFARCR